MPRSGGGVYSLPSAYDVNTGDTILPEQTETPFEDLETDANAARPIVAGGTGAATAAAARTNLSAHPVTRANDTTGSANAYVLASEVAFASLTDGDFVLFVANHSNTGAATLNVDSLGAKNIQKISGGSPTALAANDIESGGHYLATYDASVGSGTWIIHNPGEPLTAAGTSTLTNKTIDLASNTLTGTLAQFGTAISDGDFETLGQIAGFNAQTGTTYTAALADAGKAVTMNNANTNTLTIPTNAAVAFPVNSWFSVIQIGAGVTTVTGDTGVTVNGVSAGGAAAPFRYAFMTCLKVATDTWYLNVDGVA